MGLLTAKPSQQKIESNDPWLLGIEEQPDWSAEFGSTQPLKLEIGFGKGEFLLQMAAREPNINFVGIDFYHPGMERLLSRIREHKLDNVRLVHGDVRDKLPHLFADEELEAVYINFPDPWPRERHRKRRLIQPGFVSLLAQKLKEGGRLYVSTDSHPYALEMREYGNAHPKLSNCVEKEGIRLRRPALPKTQFEKSFLYAGDPVYYLEFVRGGTADINDPDVELNPNDFESPDAFLTQKFKTAEADAHDSCDLKRVADQLVEAGDREWARRIYTKAEQSAEDCLDLNWLASSLSEQLNDREWAARVYQKAEEAADSSLDLNWLAYSVHENLDDPEWARKLYARAEARPQSVRELCDLADSIGSQLRDVDWAINVFKKAEQAAQDHSEFYELADNIVTKLGDAQWARDLYQKAEAQAEDCADLLSVVESVFEKLGDGDWAIQIFSKAEKAAEDSDDFCSLAESLVKYTGDIQGTLAFYAQAETLAQSPEDKNRIAARRQRDLNE